MRRRGHSFKLNGFLSTTRSTRGLATGLDDLLAELGNVSTGSKTSSSMGVAAPKLRKVVRTKTAAASEEAIPVKQTGTQVSTERLNQSLRDMKDLEAKISSIEQKKKSLIANIATAEEAEREGVGFPSARLPMSSQETRLEGGDQEFRPLTSEVPTVVPADGTIGHMMLIASVTSQPAILEDANGPFVEFTTKYRIPFDEPKDVFVTVRGYGDLFIEYCCEYVKVNCTVHCNGWLMPGPDLSSIVVCLPKGGNITVVKYA